MPQILRFSLIGALPEGLPEGPFTVANALRAVVLRWIHRADPAAAEQIHGANQPKPYMVGPLAGEGQESWFDVSVLADWLVPVLLEGARQDGPRLQLGPYPFQRGGHGERVAKADWEELYSAPLPREALWRVALWTPTAHHPAGGLRRPVILPTPANYFGSWQSRWELCCELPLAAGLRSVVLDHMIVASCAGQTREVHLQDRAGGGGADRLFCGFVGEVTFQVLPPGDQDRDVLRSLHALARLSPFCGTGVETMRGMGQTQLLAPKVPVSKARVTTTSR